MSMNAQARKVTIVIPTPYVPTLKDRMSAAVLETLREMVKSAQVNYFIIRCVMYFM